MIGDKNWVEADLPTIFIDESGFTGANLLDIDQPVFVTAASSIPSEASQSLLRGTIGELRAGATEHSHSVLVKSSEGRQQVLRLVEALATHHRDDVTYYLTHKKFALLAKLIDNWVEPAMFRDGYDLYEDGGALAYANMLWACLPTFEGAERFEALLREYQRFSRDLTEGGFTRFFHEVEWLMETCQRKESSEELAMILHSRSLGVEHLSHLGAASSDIAYPSVFGTIARWDARIGGPFAVVHDESKNMVRRRALLEAVLDAGEGERTTVAFDARMSYTLPFRATGLGFGRSQDHAQIQICDIVAGAAAYLGRFAASRTGREDYALALMGAGLESMSIGMIWPNVEDVKRHGRAASGMGNPLDVTARLHARAGIHAGDADT